VGSHIRHCGVALLLVYVSVRVQAQSTSCCGLCEMTTCVDLHPEEPGRARLEQSSELFFGSVVAAEVLTCCENDPRADVTFKVTRRWKGADTPRVVVRTRACTEIYPFALGRNYLVSATGTPPVLSICFPPLEGTAAEQVLGQLDKPNPPPKVSTFGCYEIEIARPTTGWSVVPSGLELMSHQRSARYEPIHTFYYGRSIEAGATESMWLWRTIDDSHIRIEHSDGATGWVLEVEPTEGGLRGVATPVQEIAPFRGQPVPVKLVKVSCR
jgi:hypothetical protein